MKDYNFLDLKNDIKIFRGFPACSLKEIVNNQKDYKKMKILGFENIRKMLENNITDFIKYNYFDLSRKLKKDYCYIKQHDIVMPLLSVGNKIPILYLENEPAEKLLYNTTVIVIRSENSIISKYLFILLKSKLMQNKILELSDKSNKMNRITIEILQNLKIPLVDEAQRNIIINKYFEIENKKKIIEKEENNFWNDINKLTQ